MRAGKIKPSKQPIELPCTDGDDFFTGSGPFEAMLFKTLVPQAKFIMIPIQDLDDGALSVAKHEQISGKRVELHGLLHQDGKPVDGLVHIGAAHCRKDITGKGCTDHCDRTVFSSCLTIV